MFQREIKYSLVVVNHRSIICCSLIRVNPVTNLRMGYFCGYCLQSYI